MSFFDRLKRVWRAITFWQQEPSSSIENPPNTTEDHALVLAITKPKPKKGLLQLRFLLRVLTSEQKRTFFGLLTFALISGSAFCYFIAQDHLGTAPAVGGTYVEAIIGTPRFLNPVLASPAQQADSDITSLVYSSLFKLNEHLEPIPDLVESYEWLDGGKTLQIKLRTDARFHDDDQVDSSDVLATIEAIKNPNWRSPLAKSLKEITPVRVDEHTLQLQYTEPNPKAILNLTFGILPSHRWSEVSEANVQLADLNNRPVGSGPYRVTSFTRDSKGAILHYDLERFERYYGVKPYIEHIRFQFFTAREEALKAFKEGRVNGLAFSAWEEIREFGKKQNETPKLELPQVTTIIYNTKDPLLASIAIREALTKAINAQEIQELLQAPTTLIQTPFPYLDTTSSTQTFDIERSRELLEKAGWKLAEGASVRTLAATSTSGTPMELSLTIRVPDQPDLIKIAQALQRFWSLMGAKVAIESGDGTELLRDTVTHRDHQIYLSFLRLNADESIHDFWASSEAAAGLNFSQIASKEIDTAIAKADTATTTEMIRAARLQLVDAIQKTYPAYFLLRPSYAYAISDDVKGVESMKILKVSDRFQYLHRWYIDTKWIWK